MILGSTQELNVNSSLYHQRIRIKNLNCLLFVPWHRHAEKNPSWSSSSCNSWTKVVRILFRYLCVVTVSSKNSGLRDVAYYAPTLTRWCFTKDMWICDSNWNLKKFHHSQSLKSLTDDHQTTYRRKREPTFLYSRRHDYETSKNQNQSFVKWILLQYF